MENALKDKIAAGNVCIGGWLTVASAEVAEALASVGFDWIAVDMEHGSCGIAEAERAFVACERHGCTPLVRLPEADPILARRLLDAGAAGFLVPAVSNAAAFSKFAHHCFFPPKGARGVSLERFNLWGDRFDDYMRNFSPILVPMIENRAGVAAAGSLAQLDCVDALFFGPYDLSADLGAPGEFETQAFAAAKSHVLEACRSHHKAAGGHQVMPDPESLRGLISDGFRLIAFATDIIAMRHALTQFGEVVPS